MGIVDFLNWLNDTTFAESIRDSVWLFPTFETIHVAAIVLVAGSIAGLDLRLAGLMARDRPVTEIANEMLPWTWAAFVVATIFGFLLFASKPMVYLAMAFFDAKLILIVLAGLNMLLFQQITWKSVGRWDRAVLPPVAVRLAAGLSLAFWISVVICGRFIGFV